MIAARRNIGTERARPPLIVLWVLSMVAVVVPTVAAPAAADTPSDPSACPDSVTTDMSTSAGRSSGTLYAPGGKQVKVTIYGSADEANYWGWHRFQANPTVELSRGSWSDSDLGIVNHYHDPGGEPPHHQTFSHSETWTVAGDGVYSFSGWMQSYYGANLEKYVSAEVIGGVSEADCKRIKDSELAGPNPGLRHGDSCWSPCADPVSTRSGAFYDAIEDIATIPGRSPALSWTRTYLSANADVVGPMGEGWSHDWNLRAVEDAASGFVEIVQETGTSVFFESDGNGGYVAAPRVYGTLTTTASGGWLYTRGKIEHFEFDSAGRLINVSDLDGDTTSLGYDGAGQLTSVTDSIGRQISLTWAGGRITKVTDPSSPAREVSYTYNAGGRLETVTDVEQGVTSYAYDTGNRVASVTDPRHIAAGTGLAVVNVYDSDGRVTQQTDEAGGVFTFDYTTVPGSTIVTDPAGNKTRHDYDAEYRLLTAVTTGYGSPEAATTQYSRDPNHLGITQILDPRQGTTTISYDTAGNPLTIVDPLARSTSLTYNALDLPETITDPSGVTTTITYTSAGRPLTASRPLLDGNGAVVDTATAELDYDPSRPEDLIELTAPNGGLWTFTHDPATGYTESTTDPLGNTSTAEYNTIGWPTAVEKPTSGTAGSTPPAGPGQVVFAIGSGAITANDIALRDRMTAAGHTVTTVEDQDLAANTAGADIIVISHSVTSGDVGPELDDLTIPVLTSEAFLYDDFGLIDPSLDPDNRGTVWTDTIDIASTHPVAGGLTGTTQLTTANKSFGFGIAGGSTFTVATYPNGEGALIVLEAGNQRGDGIASPGCRIAFPGGNNAADAHTADGWTLFDATIAYAMDNCELGATTTAPASAITFATGTGTVTTDDQALIDRLEGNGHVVTVTDDFSLASHLAGADAVIISATVSSANIGPEIDDVTVPVITAEAFLYDDFGLVDPIAVDNRGTIWTDTITITDPTHPLAAGLSGATQVITTSKSLAYGLPGGDTATIANFATGEGALLVLESGGARGDSGTSPGCRIGYPAATNSATRHTAQGWSLFDTAVSYALTGCADAPAETVIARTTFARNAFGDITKITLPDGEESVYAYDENRNVAQTQLPSGESVVVGYDDLDRPATSIKAPGTADEETTTYTYWPDGRLKSWYKQAGSEWANTYDPIGRLRTATDPNGQTTTYGYDSSNNLTTIELPGGDCAAATKVACITRSFDAANQLTAVDFSDSTPDITSISYDELGRRDQMTDGTGTSAWDYDSLGRLTSHTNGAGQTLEWGYDIGGNQTSITYPGQTTAVQRTFDLLGRLTDLTDTDNNTISYEWDAASQLTEIKFPNATGNVDRYRYDITGGLSEITMLHNGTVSASLDYDRNATGSVTLDASLGLPTLPSLGSDPVSYSYDQAGRLVNEDGRSYDHDSSGNLTVTPTALLAYDDAGQLCHIDRAPGATASPCGTTPAGAETFSYDNRGNRTASVDPTDGTRTYTWDLADRLTQTTGPEGTTTYTYDGDGLRASSTTGGVTTYYTWDTSGALPVLVETRTGTDTTRYLYGPTSAPIADQLPDGSRRYYHADQLGSTRQLTDATGAVVGAWTYDAFGTETATSGTATTPFRWAGEHVDDTTGLVYLRARYYDPRTSQFLNRDPLLALSGDPHGYAWTNPINITDPTGLLPGSGFLAKLINTGGCVLSGIGDLISDGLGVLWRNKTQIAAALAFASCVTGNLLGCAQATKWALGASVVTRFEELLRRPGGLRNFDNVSRFVVGVAFDVTVAKIAGGGVLAPVTRSSTIAQHAGRVTTMVRSDVLAGGSYAGAIQFLRYSRQAVAWVSFSLQVDVP